MQGKYLFNDIISYIFWFSDNLKYVNNARRKCHHKAKLNHLPHHRANGQVNNQQRKLQMYSLTQRLHSGKQKVNLLIPEDNLLYMTIQRFHKKCVKFYKIQWNILEKCFIEKNQNIITIKNQICFQNISKYTSKLSAKKLGYIIKAVGSNMDFSIEEKVQKREREMTGHQQIGSYIVQ